MIRGTGFGLEVVSLAERSRSTPLDPRNDASAEVRGDEREVRTGQTPLDNARS